MKWWQERRILCMLSTDVFFQQMENHNEGGLLERREIYFKKLAHTMMKVKIQNLLARLTDWRLKEELSSSSKAAGRFPSYSREINIFNWDQASFHGQLAHWWGLWWGMRSCQGVYDGVKHLTWCRHIPSDLRPPTRLHSLKVPHISNSTTLLIKPLTHGHLRSKL